MMAKVKGPVQPSGFMRQKKDVAKQDRISNLPDSILEHILSFLPTHDAIKMVIFPRFGNLWTSIHTIDFDKCYYHVCKGPDVPSLDENFLSLVRGALILHHRPTIYKFRLRFLFLICHSEGKRVAKEIDTWIHFAIMRKVNVLDLDFLACAEVPGPSNDIYKLPDFVFTSDFLTEMKLAFCDVITQGKTDMRSLRSLSLTKIGLSDKKLNEIIHGCPLLEDLLIIKCYDFDNLNFTHSNVKNLTLDVSDVRIIKVSCPNLLSLNLSCDVVYVELIDMYSLVNASIDFKGRINTSTNSSNTRFILQKLHHVKVITWSSRTTSMLVQTYGSIIYRAKPCLVNSWKSLVVKTRLSEWYMRGIISALRHSHSMEELTIICEREPCSSTPYKAEEIESDEDDEWSSVEFTSLEHHLERVQILGFLAERRVIQFVEFLLKKALVLEKMVITSKLNSQTDAQELLEFSKKLLSLPRASPSAIILFS